MGISHHKKSFNREEGQLMETGGINYVNFLWFLVFLIPLAYMNYRLRFKLNKRMIFAILRMTIQLSLVGLFLQYIFKLDNNLINISYVLLMMTVASFSVMKSCGKQQLRFLPLVLLSFAVPNLIMLLFFNTFIVDLETILSARYTIPVAGMLLGNSLNSIIVAVNHFYNSVNENRREYFTSLSLSGSRIEALRPYFRQALMTTLNPTLASIETIGLVALPGMMTGQILGGALPLTAIKYQIAIMIAILVVRYFAAILTIVLTALFSFDDFGIPLDI